MPFNSDVILDKVLNFSETKFWSSQTEKNNNNLHVYCEEKIIKKWNTTYGKLFGIIPTNVVSDSIHDSLQYSFTATPNSQEGLEFFTSFEFE